MYKNTVTIKLLAKALHETAFANHNLGESVLRQICDSEESHYFRAEKMLKIMNAHDPLDAEADNGLCACADPRQCGGEAHKAG